MVDRIVRGLRSFAKFCFGLGLILILLAALLAATGLL